MSTPLSIDERLLLRRRVEQFDWLVQGGDHNAGNVPQEAEVSDRFNPLHDDADPVGTRTTHERTADFPPHAREMVRKYYPDGTSRAWFRRRGGEWTAVELDGPEPLPREAAAEEAAVSDSKLFPLDASRSDDEREDDWFWGRLMLAVLVTLALFVFIFWCSTLVTTS